MYKQAVMVLALITNMALAAHAAVVDVKMLDHTSDGGRGFEPAIVHIHAGDSVHFIATDRGHNVQSIDGMRPEGAAPFTGKISGDLTVTFVQPGIYGYKCLPHYWLGMVGLIVVDNTNNLAAARSVPQPGAAKTTFEALFSKVNAS